MIRRRGGLRRGAVLLLLCALLPLLCAPACVLRSCLLPMCCGTRVCAGLSDAALSPRFPPVCSGLAQTAPPAAGPAEHASGGLQAAGASEAAQGQGSSARSAPGESPPAPLSPERQELLRLQADLEAVQHELRLPQQRGAGGPASERDGLAGLSSAAADTKRQAEQQLAAMTAELAALRDAAEQRAQQEAAAAALAAQKAAEEGAAADAVAEAALKATADFRAAKVELKESMEAHRRVAAGVEFASSAARRAAKVKADLERVKRTLAEARKARGQPEEL